MAIFVENRHFTPCI